MKEIELTVSTDKKMRLDIDDEEKDVHVVSASKDEWIHIDKIVLKMSEKLLVLQNGELNDLVINCAQKILQNQFPLVNGFQSMLLLPTMSSFDKWISNYIQIYHVHGNHWITVTTKGCGFHEVMIYDSLYDDIDCTTKRNCLLHPT